MSETENPKDTADSGPKTDNQNGDKKGESIEVHSANAWENADLGDEDRKNKFLRLMGAGKKDHHGRFVIGDHNPEHARKTDETQKLQDELEDQYTHSMQHRLAGGRRGHIGLGYHDADVDPKPSDDSEQQADKEDDVDNDGETEQGAKDVDDGGDDEKVKERPEEVKDKSDRKRGSTGGGAQEDAPEEKKMKFVKSSS